MTIRNLARARRRQRLGLLALIATSLAGATTLMLTALSDNLLFFYTPSQLHQLTTSEGTAGSTGVVGGRQVRIGGLVEPGSLRRQGTEITFAITDGQTTIEVSYRGVLPGLFREGDGVIAEGVVDASGRLRATSVLARHDENYRPPTDWYGPPS